MLTLGLFSACSSRHKTSSLHSTSLFFSTRSQLLPLLRSSASFVSPEDRAEKPARAALPPTLFGCTARTLMKPSWSVKYSLKPPCHPPRDGTCDFTCVFEMGSKTTPMDPAG